MAANEGTHDLNYFAEVLELCFDVGIATDPKTSHHL